MNKRNRLIFIAIATIIAIACACPMTSLPTSGEPTTAPIIPISTLPPAPSANVLLQDDFSAPNSEFEEYSGDGGSAEISNGVYIVRSTGDLWQWGKTESQFSDAVIEVDVTMAEGPTNYNAGFGVICRLATQADDSVDGYMLAISGDGYYSIRSITASTMTALVDWAESSAINQGYETNRIRATCNGNELILEVNGEVVASANAIAGGSTSGAIAFSAISFEFSNGEPNAEGHFDNLVVSEP